MDLAILLILIILMIMVFVSGLVSGVATYFNKTRIAFTSLIIMALATLGWIGLCTLL